MAPYSQPLISVVVPVFNASAYVRDAIRSALDQSWQKLEVVVVDDGSTDTSKQCVHEFTDPRIRYFYQSNQGQSAAINAGVMYSRGEYIKILDADDWIDPDHLKHQLHAIGGRTDVIASCRWGCFLNDFRKPRIKKEFTNANYDDPLEWIIDSLVRDEGMMGGWMWLIPRAVWERCGGYDVRLSLNNDFHFSIQLLLSARGVRFAQDAVYSYRKGVPGALSGSYGRKAMESAFLTTDLGTRALLARENSQRTRKIAADRFQSWLFHFYPGFPGLVDAAEERIAELGGSALQLQGGRLMTLLIPLIGWKRVRSLQDFAYRSGWQRVLSAKTRKRLAKLE